MLRPAAIRLLALGAVCFLVHSAVDAVAQEGSWNEIVHGELSGDPAAPTPLRFVHPGSGISGTVGGGDVDIIAITVPQYHTIEAAVNFSYSGTSQSFAGLQMGSRWTAGLGAAVNPTVLLGWTHFGPAAAGAGVGEDILDNLAAPKSGSAGFTVPLGPGVYTLLLQDTGGLVDYALDFEVLRNLRPVGDFDGDGLIGRFDLAKWRFNFAVTDGSDADGDGDSDGNDFLIWQRNVNKTFTVNAVPEPSAGLLAGVASLAVHGARVRKRRPFNAR